MAAENLQWVLSAQVKDFQAGLKAASTAVGLLRKRITEAEKVIKTSLAAIDQATADRVRAAAKQAVADGDVALLGRVNNRLNALLEERGVERCAARSTWRASGIGSATRTEGRRRQSRS